MKNQAWLVHREALMEIRRLRLPTLILATAMALLGSSSAWAATFTVHSFDLGERVTLTNGQTVWTAELDVSLEGLTGPEQEQLELQASIYAGVLEACLAVPACRSWTVFGFSDRYAWDELGDADPLLFTGDYEPKPAFFAAARALSGP